MMIALAFTGSLLAGSGDLTQTPSAHEASLHADAIIERNNAGEWFVNVTTTDIPRVRHTRSGMVCTFPEIDDRNIVRVYPTVPGGPAKGDDVGCSAWWGTTYASAFASRYPQDPDEETLVNWAVSEINQNWTNIQPVEETFDIVVFGDQTVPRVGIFKAIRNGSDSSNALILRKINGWAFKLRTTDHLGDGEFARHSTAIFAITLPGGLEAANAEAQPD